MQPKYAPITQAQQEQAAKQKTLSSAQKLQQYLATSAVAKMSEPEKETFFLHLACGEVQQAIDMLVVAQKRYGL